jgi:hypothetical protein
VAWPSQVTFAFGLGLVVFEAEGNEKSGGWMRRSWDALAPGEFGQSLMSLKRGRLPGSGFGGRGALVRCEAARLTQGSSSAPHWKLSQSSEAVALCHDGQGLRKPACSRLSSDGRVRSGDGAHDGMYEVQPEAA